MPVAKVKTPKSINDFRPIALTSLVMKVFEKIIKRELVKAVEDILDPFQFAYRSKRGVDDAVLTLLNLVFRHLESPATHAHLLFLDFTSAFNTIQPHILASKLLSYFNLCPSIVGWIVDFLTDRSQRVRVNSALSDVLFSSTGSPQGCVLSPILYILYTDDCRSSHPDRHVLTFADDTVIVSLLQGEDTAPGPVVDDFIHWCDDSSLNLNVTKTKDMCIDFRRNSNPPLSTVINGETVERVSTFKYLGVVIDNKLSFNENTDTVYKNRSSDCTSSGCLTGSEYAAN